MMTDLHDAHALLMGLTTFAAGLFLWAGWTDIRTMRIPNLVSLGLVAAWVARAIFVPQTVSLIGDPVFMILVFIPFFALHAFGNGGFGAGDVKLITTGALWFGWSGSETAVSRIADGIPDMATGFDFLAVMAVAGMVQSLLAVLRQRGLSRRAPADAKAGLSGRWFATAGLRKDALLHLSVAAASAASSAADSMGRVPEGVAAARSAAGKIRVPYGPSIVAGALAAFWIQLVSWGILS